MLLTRAKELNKYIEPPAPNSVLTPILKSKAESLQILISWKASVEKFTSKTTPSQRSCCCGGEPFSRPTSKVVLVGYGWRAMSSFTQSRGKNSPSSPFRSIQLHRTFSYSLYSSSLFLLNCLIRSFVTVPFHLKWKKTRYMRLVPKRNSGFCASIPCQWLTSKDRTLFYIKNSQSYSRKTSVTSSLFPPYPRPLTPVDGRGKEALRRQCHKGWGTIRMC